MDQQRTSIVYVDDDPDDRQRVRDHIEREISNPFVYLSSGEDLMARISSGEVSMHAIILVDLVLPGMSGFEVVQEIRERHKHMDRAPLIVVTGSSDPASIATAKEVRADAYIEKPMTLLSLMYVLKRKGKYELEILDRRPVTGMVPATV